MKGSRAMKHTITKASACYTGGGVYVYYGQLEIIANLTNIYFEMALVEVDG